jgi:hypothetical protein
MMSGEWLSLEVCKKLRFCREAYTAFVSRATILLFFESPCFVANFLNNFNSGRFLNRSYSVRDFASKLVCLFVFSLSCQVQTDVVNVHGDRYL